MNVFELAAYATIVQVAVWLFLVVIKALIELRRMVKGSKEKPGKGLRNRRVN